MIRDYGIIGIIGIVFAGFELRFDDFCDREPTKRISTNLQSTIAVVGGGEGSGIEGTNSQRRWD